MTLDTTSLFVPLQVKNKTLPNRVVMPPMVANRPLTSPAACEWYGRRALGGAGLVIVESTDSPRFGLELTAETLRPLVQAIHAGGALAAIQLFPGRRGQSVMPADLSLQEIWQLLDQYKLAAQICAEAGFDGIEPHGAHNYLLNKFFSPSQNLRSDEYGGTPANRMRLALAILEAIRPTAEKHGLLILYRHTPNAVDYTVAESVEFAGELLRAGVDILDISPASDTVAAERAAPFMKLGAPVIGVRKLDRPFSALEALTQKRCSLVAVGRGLIADPDWPLKMRTGRMKEIVQCTYCDECHRDLRAGRLVSCTEWKAEPHI